MHRSLICAIQLCKYAMNSEINFKYLNKCNTEIHNINILFSNILMLSNRNTRIIIELLISITLPVAYWHCFKVNYYVNSLLYYQDLKVLPKYPGQKDPVDQNLI
jgi:hypothetical protein